MRAPTAPTLPTVLQALGVFVTSSPGDHHPQGCASSPGWDHFHYLVTVHRGERAATADVVLGPIDYRAGTAARLDRHPTTGRLTPEGAAHVFYAVWSDVETLGGDDPDGVGMIIDARYHAGNLSSEGDLRELLAELETVRGWGRVLERTFGTGELEALAEAVREW